LSEMKSNFVSSVSHELRAPVASVRLLTESLARGKITEPARQQEYFRFILQECRRLSGLVENVLDFARIEQRRKQYEFEPTDLVALVTATVKLMEPNAAEKQVSLTLEMSDTAALPPQPSMDGRAIQQALVNLIDNAIKHSPPGETVVVSLAGGTWTGSLAEGRANLQDAMEHGLNPKRCLLLSVSDHGPGIPPEEQGRIFERFYRRGSELRRETQGVGIGLSIVKHVAEAHGGQVRVLSAVGRGACFTIELPAGQEPSNLGAENGTSPDHRG
jgi:signal transduction histidine kinase